MSGMEIPAIAAAAEGGGAAAGAGALSWLTPQVAAGLMLGGTGAQMLAARQQQKQQREILNRQFEKNDTAARLGTQSVLTEGAKQGGAAQLADMTTAENAMAGRTMADLKGAGADIIDTAGGNGAQSQAFLTAKADRALTEGNRQTAIARELAKVRSTGEVQGNNAMGRADLAERQGSAGATARAGTQAAQLDAAAVQAPWYGDLGKIASMVGTLGMLAPAAGAGGAIAADAPAAGFGGAEYGMAERLASGAAPAMAGGAGGLSSLARALPAAGMLGARRNAWAGR